MTIRNQLYLVNDSIITDSHSLLLINLWQTTQAEEKDKDTFNIFSSYNKYLVLNKQQNILPQYRFTGLHP